MLTVYAGRSRIEPRRTLPRGGWSSRGSWFVELYCWGRYVGLAR